MNERLKTHSKTQKKSADLVSNKLRIGVFQRYQMKCKSVSKKSPRYSNRDLVSVGAYAKGSDPMLDKAIALWPQLEGYLQQGIFERADWEASLQGLERIFPTVS